MERKYKKKSYAEMIKEAVKKLSDILPNGFTKQKVLGLTKTENRKTDKKLSNKILNKAFKKALLGNIIRIARDFDDGRHTLYNISLGSPKTPPKRIRLKRLRTNVRLVESSQESLTFSPIMRCHKNINQTISQEKQEDLLEQAADEFSEK